MSTHRLLLRGVIALALASAWGGGLVAQTGGAKKKSEPPAASRTTKATNSQGPVHQEWHPGMTVQQVFDKLGLSENPGPDPDPSKIYFHYGERVHINKVEKKNAVFDVQKGWVRPNWHVNFSAEIYRQNDKYVWFYMKEVPKPEPPMPSAQAEAGKPDSGGPYLRLSPAQIDTLKNLRKEFLPVDVAGSNDVVHFKDSSKGLPDHGSWRNSLAITDLNGDGHLDLVTPPQRGGAASITPVVFLGDGKGNWTQWKTVSWPIAINYGGVAAADFNKDGKMDLVFAVHLRGPVVFLGDGKGHFIDSSDGLPKDFPTRRVVVTDLDGDGWPDFVVISEGPALHDQRRSPGSRLRGYLNRDKGTKWERVDLAPNSEEVAGDWLVACDLNGDGYPDFAGSSIFFNAMQHLYVSSEKGKWVRTPDNFLPQRSYVTAVAAGHFTSKKRDDVIVSFVRIYPEHVNPHEVEPPPMTNVTGLDRISDVDGKLVRSPIVRYEGRHAIFAMGTGDLNGDGNLDIAYALVDPRELKVLLGDGHGGFREAKIDGISWPDNPSYDIKIADVNGDGRADLISMFEESEGKVSKKPGSIHVWLNEGTK